MNIEKEDISSKVPSEKNKKRKIFILLFIILIIIILLILFYFFKMNKGKTSDTITTENTQDQEQDIQEQDTQEQDEIETEPNDSEVPDEVESCAPVYTGGVIDSHTSTDTTWSYYFKEATSESVLEYVQDLKSNGWSSISEKTIVNTSFWDLQKENCYVSLRYHSTDNGVILEIKLESE